MLYLCALLGQSLDLKYHSLIKCRTASLNLKKIRLIQHLSDQDSCEVLFCSLVPSHLDYGNGLLFGACDNVIKKIQYVQNFSAKIVLKEDLKSSSIAALHKLHWLPIRAHINFKIQLMVFKCLTLIPLYSKKIY